MRADEFDVSPLRFVGKGDDEPVVIALDVEHHAVVTNDAGARDDVHGWVLVLQGGGGQRGQTHGQRLRCLLNRLGALDVFMARVH